MVRAMLRAFGVIAACASAAPASAGPELAAPVATGLQPQVEFGAYTPLSSSSEILRRLVTPLAAVQVQRALASSGDGLREQSIDLTTERFVLYVPERAPARGYGLLSFVSPQDEAQLPQGWSPVLDRYGVIFVSALRSGNDADVLGRREPLALLGAWNVMKRYPVDPQRVYVGGFSGGSRIALRLALAYPDLFRGALLNAGSDPIDAGPPSPPPRELFERFQEETRIVFVTGERDALHLSMDASSLASLRALCVFDTASRVTHGAAHELAAPPALSWALGALDAHRRPDAARLTACRASLDRQLSTRIGQVRALIDAGKADAARNALEKLDRNFGGLAAPQSSALARELE